MDPANPVRQVNDHRLTSVQRWVVSVLAVTTILHLSVGLIVAAYFLDSEAVFSRIGLCVIGAGFGVVAAAVGRLIHQKPIASSWLLLGLVPGVVGVLLVAGRVSSSASYRAPMRSRLDDVDAAAAVERALDLGVVGVGGRLESPPRDLADALARVSEDHGDRVARRLERFAAVTEGAEVWTRDPAGLFHRGRIAGPWRYDAARAAFDVDLTHVRSCAWAPGALAEHELPAAVSAAFRRGGRNFQRIRALSR